MFNLYGLYSNCCVYLRHLNVFINNNIYLENIHTNLIVISYLFNSVHYVYYSGFYSDTFMLTSGVSQGSNLGPQLFLTFANDLQLIIKCHYLMFADDIKLLKGFYIINNCLFLQKPNMFMKNKKLKFNTILKANQN